MIGYHPQPRFALPTPVSTAFDTSFPLTENPISQGSIWVNGGTDGTNWQDVRTTPGEAFATGFFTPGGFNDDIAHLKTSFRTFTPNQYVQGTVFKVGGYAPTGAHEVELLLRFSITAGNARGYEVLFGAQGGVAVVLWNGTLGDFQALYDPGDILALPADGDLMYAQIVGNIITVKKNATLITTVDITANDKGGNAPHNVWSSGQPGLGMFPQSGSDVVLANEGWKQWQADNI